MRPSSPCTLLLLLFVGSFLGLARSEPLKCVQCTRGCPSKGQILFPLSTARRPGDGIQYLNGDFPGWLLDDFPGPFGVTGPSTTITAGKQWKTSLYYIVTVYFTSPTVGIDTMDFYLNKGDSCRFHSESIAPNSILYSVVFQRKDAAVTNQWCQYAHSPLPVEDFKVGTFSRSKFTPNGGYIHTDDLQFSARYNGRREVVQLSAAPSQIHLDNFMFHIPQMGNRARTANIWLQSGESCNYLLDQHSKDTQGFISVYRANPY